MTHTYNTFGWGDTIVLTPEKVKTAKKWWSSLSINEQKAFKLKHLGKDYPNCSVYTDRNIVAIWEGENSPKS